MTGDEGGRPQGLVAYQSCFLEHSSFHCDPGGVGNDICDLGCWRRILIGMPHHPTGRRYSAMGHDPNQNQTPDLFSTVAGASPNQASEATAGRPSRRPALPKDLPKAIRHLADEGLDWLLEAKRRGRRAPGGGASHECARGFVGASAEPD